VAAIGASVWDWHGLATREYFKALVQSLGLAICLRVVRQTVVQGSVGQFEECCQKALMKILSLSDIRTLGRPCRQYKLSRNACAIVLAVNGCFRGMKCPYFKNLSTTAKMVSNLLDFGSPSIKSSPIVRHASGSIGRGCKRPGSFTFSVLAC
jgi:hypothetical protein